MNSPSPEVFAASEISGGLCPILPSAIDPDAASVLVRLLRAGHRAYLVGGCVRDLLLGGTPKDFDIATSARPRQVKKLFRNSRIIGRRFRLVHVLFAGMKTIEVSTFRRDPNAGEEPPVDDEPIDRDGDVPAARAFLESEAGDGGEDGDDEAEDLLIREDNVYGTEAEDAVRRDFTINGLFYDIQSESVLDYVGGVADLRRRVLRTIGDATRRVREDPVRILRAVKFAVRLDLSLDPGLAAAMAEHHEDLKRSAAPRVFEEILRMLGGPHPERSVELLARLGVLRVLFHELPPHAHADGDDPRLGSLLARLAAVGEVDRGRRALPTALYLAVLFYDEILRRMAGDEGPGEGGDRPPSEAIDSFLRPIGQRFRIAKRDTARVRAMFLALRRIEPDLVNAAAHRGRRRSGMADFVRREFFHDALLLMRIARVGEGRDLAPVVEWEHREQDLLRAPRPRAPAPPPAPAREPISSTESAPDEGGHRRRRRRRRRRSSSPPPLPETRFDD